MRRLAPFFGIALLLAGCGGAKTVSPTAKTVIGRLPANTRAARADPEAFRAAVARKNAAAAEAFEELLAADEQWRELVPQVDELRGRQKLKGKPTPEQVEELKQVKEELRRLEDELATAAARRDELLQKVPNPPHESVPDEVEDDAEGAIVRVVGEPPE